MDLFEDNIIEDASFQVNETFAAEYAARKKAEELSKLKDKYGQDYEESDYESTIYSSEDENAELDTAAVDAAIFQTIAKIRDKDPAIYDPSVKVFDTAEATVKSARMPGADSKKSKKEKALKLKDVERMALLGQLDETEARPTPRQEEEALRREMRAAFNQQDDDDDDLFVERNDQDSKTEDTYRRFLIESVGSKTLKKALKAETADMSNDDKQFLTNYILNRGWLEEDAPLPRHEDIVADSDNEDEGPSGANAMPVAHVAPASQKAVPKAVQKPGFVPDAYKPLDETVDDDQDAEFEDLAETFETKYNFRFEEAGGTELVTHARDVDSSVRKTDTSRKEARQARLSRKEEEKLEKRAEVERLKALKKEAILTKLEKVKQAIGKGVDDKVLLESMDLEGDFDESKHAQEMAKVFGEAYYQEDDDEKPTWDDDIDITDIVGPEDDEEAYDPSLPVSKSKSKKKAKKEKKKAKAAAEPEADSALLDSDIEADEAERQAVSKDLDEYYNLDYEDMIGDLPTRFKYVEVPKTDIGLSDADILMLTDRELNSYMSLKKLVPYANKDEDEKLKKSKRKKLKELKAALLHRKWGEALPTGKITGEVDLERYQRAAADQSGASKSVKRKAEGGEGPPKKKKRVGKKERQRQKAEEGSAPTAEVEA